MPYIITKKNGKPFKAPWLLLEHEVENPARNDPGTCYKLVNTTTRRTKTIGARKKCGRR